MPEVQETVEADTAIGKFKISGANVTSIAVYATLIGVVLLVWVLYGHAGDAKEGAKAVAAELRDANKEVAQALKESNKEISATLKEMSRATREQNCLLSIPQEKRERLAETCRRIAQ